MHINPNGSIILDEGETWIEERPDPEGIWRTSTLTLASGAVVTVQRHFSQIGPSITEPTGKKIYTDLFVEDNQYVVRRADLGKTYS